MAEQELEGVKPLDSDTFDEVVYDEGEPSAVLFSRAGCAVCAQVKPVFGRAAKQNAEQGGPWGFYLVDAEASFDLTQRFGLAGVPQVLVFVDGELKGQLTGKTNAGELKAALEDALA